MNIFALDNNPIKAAQYLCNKHVVKMTLETAQILCTVLHLRHERTHGLDGIPYKKTHAGHPCVLWANAHDANFKWLVTHGLAIADEYSQRYGRVHKSRDVIIWCQEHLHCGNVGYKHHTPFAKAVHPSLAHIQNPVLAYREYYVQFKASMAQWPAGKTPHWFNERIHRGN